MVKSSKVVTDRDVEMLAWIGRFRGVTSAQVAKWFVPDALQGLLVVNRRLAVLRDFGLIVSERGLVRQPAIHNLTRQGMDRVSLLGPVRHVSSSQVDHDLAVTDALIHLRALEPGLRSFTEREIRRVDAPTCADPRLAIRALEGQARRVVYPDLLTVVGDTATAHEVEYSPKESGRLRALMLAYSVRAQHAPAGARFGGVVYYARPHLVGRLNIALRKAQEDAHRYGIRGELPVTIQGWQWRDETA